LKITDLIGNVSLKMKAKLHTLVFVKLNKRT